MEKIILVDGNNLIFRSYYATAATGNLMVNSKNYPTNALYGFTNMINKIIEEEKPTFMAVAYDIGKNFRHDKYKEYKAGRSATPNELIIQLNKSKELLDAMGIKHIELSNYEADDIIGTLSKMALDDKDFIATIVSSDKDLLQLINEEVEVKLLKSKDYIRYTKEKFIEDYGIDPIKMIDLKALMGDSSDNVPGVKGIGEKTALKLLQQYNSLEGIYDSIDTIKGATHDKLVSDKDTAFFCKDICTICLNAPIKENLTDCKYLGPNNNKLIEIYKELEFYSLLKKMDFKQETTKSNYKILNNVEEINKNDKIAYYIECDNENYHNAKILGMGLYDGKNLFYVKPEMINECLDYLTNLSKRTYLTIELGLQTIHESTSKLINRGHTLKEFTDTVKRLRERNIDVVVHIINGLPYETKEMMLETVKFVNKLDIQGIKIHMLNIIKDTPLETLYNNKHFHVLTKEEYIDIVISELELLDSKIVIHRITADPDPKTLIEPTWLLKKTVLLNDIDKEMKRRNTYQGIKTEKE